MGSFPLPLLSLLLKYSGRDHRALGYDMMEIALVASDVIRALSVMTPTAWVSAGIQLCHVPHGYEPLHP